MFWDNAEIGFFQKQKNNNKNPKILKSSDFLY